MQPKQDPRSTYPFKHRILGTLSCDSPFLGIHPGVVVSGIASLFRPAPTPQGSQPGDDDIASLTSGQSSTTTLALSPTLSPDPSLYSELMPPSGATSPQPSTADRPDPFFNQPFFNDAQFLDRGWWKNVAHFAKKHKQEGIIDAAANHILNHLEFGGCLADYASLNIRYNKLRKLESIEPIVWTDNGPQDAGRVRFVNYYTISTGKVRKEKSKGSPYLKPEAAGSVVSAAGSLSGSSGASTPRISIEDHSDTARPQLLEFIMPDDITPLTTNSTDPSSLPGGEEGDESKVASKAVVAAPKLPPPPQNHPHLPSAEELALGLPEIPPLPTEPETPDLEAFTDKDARRQAEKEAKRARKAYEQAVKNREKAIKERQRIVDKRRKKAEKEAATWAAEEKKRLRRETQLLKQIDEAAKLGGVGAPSGVPLPTSNTATAALPSAAAETKTPSRPSSPAPSSQQPAAAGASSSSKGKPGSPRPTGQESNAVPRALPDHEGLVPRGLERLRWKVGGRRLQLLKGDDVRLRPRKPVKEQVQPLGDVVDIPSGDPHDFTVCRP